MRRFWAAVAAAVMGLLAIGAVPQAQAAPLRPQAYAFKYGILPGVAGLNCEYAFTVNSALYQTMIQVSLHGCQDPGWMMWTGSVGYGQWSQNQIPRAHWSVMDLWTGASNSHYLTPPKGVTGGMRSTTDPCYYGHPMVFDIWFFPGQGPYVQGGTLLHRSWKFACSVSGAWVPLN